MAHNPFSYQSPTASGLSEEHGRSAERSGHGFGEGQAWPASATLLREDFRAGLRPRAAAVVQYFTSRLVRATLFRQRRVAKGS